MSTPIYLSLAPARPLVSVVIRGPAGPAGPTGPAAGDPADLAESIHSADPLLAPADTDELAAATPGTPSLLKRIPWAALKAALAAHFDPTYLPLARRHAYTSRLLERAAAAEVSDPEARGSQE